VSEPTPVTILTGFLGAGKTTLLNRILRAPHELRIGVMVNDFGSVNIDARLVAAVRGDQIDLTNGCVCCSMRGNLVQSTLAMLDRPSPPEYLIVEASGISDPVGVAAAFRTSALRERTRLDGVIALVDAENCRNPRLDEQLVEDQVRSADLVILNKIDLVPEETQAELREWIRTLAPAARIVPAVQADVPLSVLLGVERAGPLEDMNHQGHGHPLLGSWTYCTDRPLAYRKVRDALADLPPSIFRAKGILAAADAPNLQFAVQMVGRRVAIDVLGPWGEEPRRTELVFIGEPDALYVDGLVRRFDACATDAIPLTPRERMHRLIGDRLPPRVKNA